MKQIALSMSEKEHALHDYYKRCDLWLPSNPQFRMVRFLRNKIPISLNDQVRDTRTLRSWLLKFLPDHAYYSLSQWLDPTNVQSGLLKKAGYTGLSNCVIGHDFAFDVDSDNLDHAKEDTMHIVDYLRSAGYDFKTVFSGKKGFHIYVGFDFDIPAEIQRREPVILDQKADIINELQRLNYNFDVNISTDLRRIIRIPQTIHGDTMNICEFIKPSRILSYTPTCIIADKIIEEALQ